MLYFYYYRSFKNASVPSRKKPRIDLSVRGDVETKTDDVCKTDTKGTWFQLNWIKWVPKVLLMFKNLF